MVVMALLLLFCLTVSTTIMADSIAKRKDNNELWDVDTDEFNIPEVRNAIPFLYRINDWI